MRKPAVVLAVVATFVTWSATASGASIGVPVSGSFAATGTLGGCSGSALHQVVDGTMSLTPLGASSFHLDFCLADLSSTGVLDWPVLSGTFSVTTGQGTLTGSMGGYTQAENKTPQGYPLHLLLEVAAGTAALTGATGTLVLDGFFGFAAATANGTVSGSLTLPNPTPRTKDDCKNGGWRTLTGDQGHPFANQGQCVAWAVHDTR